MADHRIHVDPCHSLSVVSFRVLLLTDETGYGACGSMGSIGSVFFSKTRAFTFHTAAIAPDVNGINNKNHI